MVNAAFGVSFKHLAYAAGRRFALQNYHRVPLLPVPGNFCE